MILFMIRSGQFSIKDIAGDSFCEHLHPDYMFQHERGEMAKHVIMQKESRTHNTSFTSSAPALDGLHTKGCGDGKVRVA